MKKWNLLKQDIAKCIELANTNNNWRYRLLKVKNKFNEMDITELETISINDEDVRVRNEALSKLNILKKYSIRKDFNNVVTIKLIIPSGCNARCMFCYNNEYKINDTKELFLDNLDNSIEKAISNISTYFPISLDITGGEPTLDVKFLRKVLQKLKSHPLINKFCRITLNTNGFNLDKIYKDLKGIVNYVNISTHHFDQEKRNEIFKTYKPTMNDYKNIVLNLLDVGIDTSTICVIHNEIKDFELFNTEYIKWCKDIGFVSLRYRSNGFDKTIDFNKYMRQTIDKYHLIQIEETNDSNWCRLSDNEGFFVFFLNGVLNTFNVSKGIEYIIHDDGKLYADYLKQVRFEDYNLPCKFIFDTKQF